MTTLADPLPSPIIVHDVATGIIPVPHRRPITVIGTDAIRAGFDEGCIRQALNTAGGTRRDAGCVESRCPRRLWRARG